MAPAIKIHPDVQNALRPLTEDEYAGLKIRLQLEGCYLPLLYFRVGRENYVLDGHHRWRVCAEEHIACSWLLREDVRSVEEAVAWVKEHQASRRNLSPEEIKELRILRIERTAAAKTRGESNRTIAAAEGVSESTVRNDLQAATAQGCAVEPPGGKVIGQDGKERPATAAVHCDRCTRTGPVKDCPRCAELQAKAGRKKGGKKQQGPRSGEEVFDRKKFNEHLSRAIAEADKLAHQHCLVNGRGQPQCVEHAGILRKIGEVVKDMESWCKSLKKK